MILQDCVIKDGRIKMVDYLYEDLVARYSGNFIPVIIPQDTIKRIEWLAGEIIKRKKEEEHHIIDNEKEFKRFVTGLMGEVAVEILLGINIVDWSVGDSKDYDYPDIKGFNIGIKTAERNKFPIIFKKNYYSQIICVRSDKRDDAVFVCGLATPEILNRYQSESLVLSQGLRERGTKTGFYGFCKLKRIERIEDL